MTLVVCMSGGWDAPWGLPASAPVDRRRGFGGDRTLCELAVAAASSGIDVELRGDIDRTMVGEIASATGGSEPRMGMGPRAVAADDFVVVPEGWDDPMSFARVALSPARKAIMMMAPPGMFGWPFVERWEAPDPIVVSRYDVGRAEHYRAMRAMGFELWANAPAVFQGVRSSGVECRWLGHGRPMPFPDPPAKQRDVAYGRNRWLPFTKRVLKEVEVTHAELPDVDQGTYLRLLGEARIFLLPMWMTGIARVFLEARAMGTVVVTLRIERFPDLFDDMKGVAVADRVEDMPDVITDLLSDPARLETMSRQAMDSVRDSLAWEPYVERVRQAILRPRPEDVHAGAWAGLGTGVGRIVEDVQHHTQQRLAQAAERHTAFRRRRSVRLVALLADGMGRLRPGRRR